MNSKLFRKIIVWLVIFSTIIWTFGVGPKAMAAGGISAMYFNSDGGGNPDVYLNAIGTPEAFLQVDIFDEQAGTLNAINVCLDEMNSFDPTTDLISVTLWNDNGGGTSNGTLEASGGSADTLLATATSYTTLTSSNYMGGNCKKVTFPSLNLTVPTTWAAKLRLLVAATPAANLDASPMRNFNPIIPVGGIDVTVSNATITDWPTNINAMFPPVWLGTEGQGMMSSPLLISEIQTTGTDVDDEFIELYNRDAGMSMNFAAENMAWTLAYAVAGTSAETDLNNIANWTATVTLNTGTIPANGFYLVGGATGAGYDGTPAANKTFSFSLPATGGIVGLFSPMGNLVDLVAYGNATSTLAEGDQPAAAPATNGSIERKATPSSTATKMASGGTDAAFGNSEDTNNNAMDFVVQATSVPQAITSTAEAFSGGYSEGTSSQVIINEVFYKTGVNSGWIELYNRSGSAANIAGWKVISAGKTYTFPSNGATTAVPANGMVVIRWNAVGADNSTASPMTTLWTGTSSWVDMNTLGGDILLTTEVSAVKDYVQYGGAGKTNESTAVAAGNWTTGDYVPNSLFSESIGRRSMNGDDYNGSGDWQSYSGPSSGYPNMGGDSTAPTTVTAVTLADADNTANSGLNGNDMTITWVPASAPDSSFDKYLIYILPATTAFDPDIHMSVDNIFGGQYYNGNPAATYTYTGGGFISKDSTAGALSTGSYKAYILAVDFAGNVSANAVSAAATLSAETYSANSDTQAPYLWHMPVWQHKLGADINLMVGSDDDRALADTNPVKVIWKQGTASSLPNLGSGTATINCTAVAGDFYQCTIPWSSLTTPNADTVVGYYLSSTDAATTPNIRYMASYWQDNMSAATAQSAAIMIDVLAADGDALGDYTDTDSNADLTGYVKKSDGSIFPDNEQPKVFIEGSSAGYVTPANTTGAFTFTDNTLAPGSYNIVAFKAGYMDMMMMGYKGDSVTMYMNTGNMNMTSGTDQPMVTWTAPSQGMGAPTNIYCTSNCATIGAGESPIIIGFDRAMNPNTINDTDAANAESNIYLTTSGNDRVSGLKVYYNSNNNEARLYATTPNSLTPGVFYNIIVTQGVTDVNGNPIAGGMTADGSFSSGFTTMANNTNMFSGGNYTTYGTGGMMMPPYVKGTTPGPGSFDVAPNTNFMVEFSESMDSTSISSSSIKLYPVTNSTTWTLGDAVAATVTLDQATQRIATLNPTANLSTSYQWYELRVMGSVKSTPGVWFGNPSGCAGVAPDTCLQNTMQYSASFKVSSTTDTTAPTVKGNFPTTNQGITAGTTAVGVGLGAIEINFSEGMAPSTITSSNITLKAGTNSVATTVEWDPKMNAARIKPSNALSANTLYTVTVLTSVTDNAGIALTTAHTFNFKTGAADIMSPTVLYANGDDYSIAVSFSEPMTAAPQTDTSNWSKSVINKANYTIKTVNTLGTGAGTYSTATSLSDILNLSLSYDNASNTVMIKGLALSTDVGRDFQIFVDAVIDRSNNIITNSAGRVVTGSNAAQAPIQSSTTTYSNLGPGGGGGMMVDMGSMGMRIAGAFPMNAMASKTTTYFVDVPTAKSIPSSGKIVLTFPAGFDVTSAAKDTNSPVNNDINQMNAGTVSIASVTANLSARTVTIVTGTAATQVSDFLNMDISGIINTATPLDYGTQGYTVDIKTFNASNVMLESISTMPFFITAAGDYTLSGTFTMRNGANDANVSVKTGQTMKVFLGSPMTGPMEATITFDGDHNANYSFTGLPAGEYWMFTNQSINVLSPADAALEFNGYNQPSPVRINETTDVSSDTVDNNVIDKDVSLTKLDSGAGSAVVVNLIGNFATGGVDDNLDIFASSYNSFRVKKIAGGVEDGLTDYTLYLPDGDWMIGIGPAIPDGPMSGPMKMSDWMPPMSVSAKIVNGGSPEVSERSATANDGTIVFNISSQVSRTISGTVTNNSGTGIADAEIYAYQPAGGTGSNTKTAADGTYILKIMNAGNYMVGMHKPGMSAPPEKTVTVGAGNVTGINFSIKQASYTISGKVLDVNNNLVSYAPVWAYKTSGQGNANTTSTSNGSYILYVDNGTWQVESSIPGYGQAQYDTTITINGASVTDKNIKPQTTTSWITIAGTVTIDGSTQNYMPIRAVQYTAAGARMNKEYNSSTDATGNYTISVPAGANGTDWQYYRVDIWTPNYGEVGLTTDGVANNPANVKVANASVTGKNITIAAENLNTTTIQFDNKADYAAKEAFINIDGVTFSGTIPTPTGFHKSIRISDLSGADPTIKLTTGDYFFFVNVPGYGQYMPKTTSTAYNETKGAITIDGTGDTVQFALPDLDTGAVITISGTVSASAGEKDAWVWVGNPNIGFHTGQQANATTGAYSIVVPILTSGNYVVGANRPGYISSSPVSNAGTADATINHTLTAASNTITGKLYADANSNNSYDDGEEVANGFVRAQETTTGAETHAPVDGGGNFSASVATGTWRLYGMANGYSESRYSVAGLATDLTVTGNLTDKNIKLAANANWTNKSKSSSITPSAGGSLDDSAQGDDGKRDGTGLSMDLPPNALGSDNSAGNLSASNISSVADTDSTQPLGGEGVTVTATDNNGQPITTLDNYVDLDMVFYKADIDAFVTNGELSDLTKLKSAQVKYWDASLGDWVGLPTTRNAYHKLTADTDWTLYNGDATRTGYEKFIDDALGTSATLVVGVDYNDYKLVLSSSTNHFTVFATGLSPDGVAPSAPTGLAQTTGTGTSNVISWTAVTTNADTTPITDLYGYGVYRSTNGTSYSQVNTSRIAAGTTTYTNTTTAAWTSYYYKVTAGDDDDLESAYSSAVQMCSNKTVTNGTVNAACTITCNSGYATSGNSCVSSGGVVNPSSGNSQPIPTPVYQEHNPNKTAEVEVKDAETLKKIGRMPKWSTTSNVETQVETQTETKTQVQVQTNPALIKITITKEKNLVKKVDQKLSSNVSGKILLQVEENGEGWYVNPDDQKKYYLGRPADAYDIMRFLSLGISSADLTRAQNNPNFARRYSGKIFLQVESHGEAYYVDFDGKLHYMKDGEAAYNIMRGLGLGISNENIRKINVGDTEEMVKGVKVEASVTSQPTDTVYDSTTGSGYNFTANMALEDVGGEVRTLQILLQNLGYFPANQEVTGYYGPMTEAAVINFQKDKGIEPLGIVGPQTRQILNGYNR